MGVATQAMSRPAALIYISDAARAGVFMISDMHVRTYVRPADPTGRARDTLLQQFYIALTNLSFRIVCNVVLSLYFELPLTIGHPVFSEVHYYDCKCVAKILK